jgi:integration host factor subunit beta
MSQTKAALIATVALQTKVSTRLAEAIVNQIFSAMTETLVQGDGIEIRGFGTFTVRSYGAYQGRNPRTGAPTHVRAKRLAFFKVGKELRERIQAGSLPSR